MTIPENLTMIYSPSDLSRKDKSFSFPQKQQLPASSCCFCQNKKMSAGNRMTFSSSKVQGIFLFRYVYNILILAILTVYLHKKIKQQDKVL
jgi:hypothetical protein